MDKNPLEEIRAEIIRSQSSNYIDDFTQFGISGEVMEISNALDVYFGIDRSPKATREKELMDILNTEYPFTPLSAKYFVGYRTCNFSGVNQLIRIVKTPLASIKEKLTKENKLYIDLSSMIVSIALKKLSLLLTPIKDQNHILLHVMDYILVTT